MRGLPNDPQNCKRNPQGAFWAHSLVFDDPAKPNHEDRLDVTYDRATHWTSVRDDVELRHVDEGGTYPRLDEF